MDQDPSLPLKWIIIVGIVNGFSEKSENSSHYKVLAKSLATESQYVAKNSTIYFDDVTYRDPSKENASIFKLHFCFRIPFVKCCHQ